MHRLQRLLPKKVGWHPEMPQQRLLEDNRKSVTFQKIVMLLESQSNIMKFEYKWMFVKLDVRQMVTYEFYIYQEALVTNGKFGCKYFFLKPL